MQICSLVCCLYVNHVCFTSCNFMPRDFERPFFSRPAFSCLAFSCPAISCPSVCFMSCIFTSCIFMSGIFMSINFCCSVRLFHVLQFHVQHFQRPPRYQVFTQTQCSDGCVARQWDMLFVSKVFLFFSEWGALTV